MSISDDVLIRCECVCEDNTPGVGGDRSRGTLEEASRSLEGRETLSECLLLPKTGGCRVTLLESTL